MSYKTILVHLNNERHCERLLAAAIGLASRFGAHLTGVHISIGLAYSPVLPGSGGIVAAYREEERKVCERLGQLFDRMTVGVGITRDMRFLQPSGRTDVGAHLLQQARTADLVVTSQLDAQWEPSSILDIPERLAIESGRPILMIPLGGVSGDIGRNALVAWNDKREAARAVFDAMPFLASAQKVTVLGIEQAGEASKGLLPDTSIASTLSRHGANVVAKTSRASSSAVGTEILANVASESADLLVMGAYGHSRLTEYVFGGATHYVTRNMTVPTLMSN
jgi:nucleotide-binding universal stress UspA family protein